MVTKTTSNKLAFFSSQGNRSFSRTAEDAYEKLEKLCAPAEKQVVVALETYKMSAPMFSHV